MTIAAQIRWLHKSYGSKSVLRDLDLDVPKGSVFALLGENGAGKSTLMRILAGLLPADLGTATLLGHDAWKGSVELRHKVGYVPEKPRYYDWMSIRELGWFTGGFHKAGFVERYGEWIAEFELDPKQKLKTLSKGQYAKVGLALALAVDPELLLLDEPTSGLDLFVRREFLSSMVGLAAEGRTLIVSSHQIAEVERVASHVAFLAEGRIVFTGSMEQMRERIVRVTVATDRAPRDFAEWGKVLRVSREGRVSCVILQDPIADALGDFDADPLSLEGVYEALLARKEETPC
jgi:ABC-2 type transport system ATP-binding protein